MTEAEQLKLFWEREKLVSAINQAQNRIQQINQQLQEAVNAKNEQSNPES